MRRALRAHELSHPTLPRKAPAETIPVPLGISGTFNFMIVFQAEHNILSEFIGFHPIANLSTAHQQAEDQLKIDREQIRSQRHSLQSSVLVAPSKVGYNTPEGATFLQSL
jgi:hypothetical protein